MFLIFFVSLISVFTLMQVIVYRAYKRWVKDVFESDRATIIIKIGLIVVIIGNVLFYPRFLISSFNLESTALIQFLMVKPGGLYFASIFVLFLGVLTHSVIQVIRGFRARSKTSPKTKDTSKEGEKKLVSRRNFIKTTGMVAFTAPFIITTGLSAATHKNFRITQQTLYYPNLPSGLEGLRIVHFSDIHSGMYMNQSQVQNIFEIVNSRDPHLVTITGDFVDSHVAEIPNVSNSVNMLKTEYGVFGCPGNHDHYASLRALSDALKGTKMNLLVNSSEVLTVNGEPVSIMGVDDAGIGARNFADINRAVASAEKDSFRILLSHRPDLFDESEVHRIDLTLAGHTHGGQIAFNAGPLELYPIDFFQKYSRGHYSKGNRQLYVNVGVGLVAAPIRLVRPEITELTLTSDPGKAKKRVLDV